MSGTERRLVIEADGGARGNPGDAAYGAVVRDPRTGEVLARRAERIGHATNNVAEYRGLIAGLHAVREIDPEAHVEARLDSKLVVEQMSGRWALKNVALRELAREARAILPPGQVSYTWIPRERNKLADSLVNAVLDGIPLPGPQAIYDVPLDLDHVGEMDEPRPTVIPGWTADLSSPTLVHLARHGVTDHTLERRFSGLRGEDPSLAKLGQQQATALAAEVLARGGVDVIVSSSLARTRETAAIVAQFLVDAGVDLPPVEHVEGFAECAFGQWDGLTFAEVQQRDPDLLRAWYDDPAIAPPGGESLLEVHDRVDAAREKVLRDHPGQRVLVVSHVTPIKLITLAALDAPLHSLFRLQLDPCSISTIAWWQDGNAAVRSWADNSHLRGLETPPGV